MSKSTLEHKRKAPKRLSFAIVTISTSKYILKQSGIKKIEDKSGDLIVKILKDFNHKVTLRELIPDNPAEIRNLILTLCENFNVDVIITAGGTGITKNDLTIETVSNLLEKDLPGFGEIFRNISYTTIGSPAILTRAIAGTRRGKAIFCIPGSPNSVELALKKIIVFEAAHIIRHSRE